jgi:hypothetical protein
MTTRRSFIAGILGACAAPAIVKAGILMPVRKIVVPAFIGRDAQGNYHAVVHPNWPITQEGLNQLYRNLMDNMAFKDVPRPGGGIDRKWIPAREFYRSPP